MSDTYLTPTMVTREALRILHQKLNFIGNIALQYDDSFAKSGAKIGSALKIRQPVQYTVRSGASMALQDITETSSTLTVATQKGIDFDYTSAEWTLSIDDFSSRYLEPAMSVLAAVIESDALAMYKSVYNQVNNNGSAATFDNILEAAQKLTNGLAPRDNMRVVCLGSQANRDIINANKGLFNDSGIISKQFREGLVGRTGGFDFYENTLMPRQLTGSDNSAYRYASNVGGNVLTVATGTGTLKQGDIVTIAGVNRCHPETKTDTGILQQFVVVTDTATTATSVTVSPAMVTTGATQNVIATPAASALITKIGGVTATYDVNLAFHKEAFAIAFADLVMPKGVHQAAREVMDGISLRFVSDYDATNDRFLCRFDVLYGYLAVRPEIAVRIATN